MYESDVFSVLRSSLIVMRAFKFALADRALDCSCEYDLGSTYAKRFSDLYNCDTSLAEPSELALFDVKSTT